MKTGLPNTFRARLEYCLNKPEISRAKIIKQLSISNPTMTNWTSGGGIDDEYLFPLADLLGVPWVWLKHGDAIYKKSCKDYIANLYSTDVKIAETNEKILDSILNLTNDEIYIISEGSKFSHVSKTATKNLGYSYTEIFKMSPYDIKHELSTKFFNDMREALVTNKDVISFNTQHKKRDGSKYDVGVKFKRVELDSPTYVVIVKKV